jgi:hypothetical protein
MENSIILENRELRSKTKTMRRELEIMKQKIAMLEMQLYNQHTSMVPTVYMQPATPILPSSFPPSYMQPMNAYYPSYYEYQPEYYYPQPTECYYPEDYYDEKQIIMYPFEYASY